MNDEKAKAWMLRYAGSQTLCNALKHANPEQIARVLRVKLPHDWTGDVQFVGVVEGGFSDGYQIREADLDETPEAFQYYALRTNGKKAYLTMTFTQVEAIELAGCFARINTNNMHSTC